MLRAAIEPSIIFELEKTIDPFWKEVFILACHQDEAELEGARRLKTLISSYYFHDSITLAIPKNSISRGIIRVLIAKKMLFDVLKLKEIPCSQYLLRNHRHSFLELIICQIYKDLEAHFTCKQVLEKFTYNLEFEQSLWLFCQGMSPEHQQIIWFEPGSERSNPLVCREKINGKSDFLRLMFYPFPTRALLKVPAWHFNTANKEFAHHGAYPEADIEMNSDFIKIKKDPRNAGAYFLLNVPISQDPPHCCFKAAMLGCAPPEPPLVEIEFVDFLPESPQAAQPAWTRSPKRDHRCRRTGVSTQDSEFLLAPNDSCGQCGRPMFGVSQAEESQTDSSDQEGVTILEHSRTDT